jgi:hypothetical protein
LCHSFTEAAASAGRALGYTNGLELCVTDFDN